MVKLGVEGSLWLPVAGHMEGLPRGISVGVHGRLSLIMYSEVTVKMMKDVAVVGSISDDHWLDTELEAPSNHLPPLYKILINMEHQHWRILDACLSNLHMRGYLFNCLTSSKLVALPQFAASVERQPLISAPNGQLPRLTTMQLQAALAPCGPPSRTPNGAVGGMDRLTAGLLAWLAP